MCNRTYTLNIYIIFKMQMFILFDEYYIILMPMKKQLAQDMVELIKCVSE
jgi:hypothetical protein